MTDKDGNVIETYKYDVFGKPQILNNTAAVVEVSTIGNPYMFTSRRYDPETTLYYYRARMYNPQIARFMQTDPIGYSDGMGWYAYCGNNPIIRFDPFGLKAGDRYLSAESAAQAAMLEIYGKSVDGGVEYAGWIYKNRFHGTYSYTTAKKGDNDSANPGFSWKNTVAVYHSHGKTEAYYDNENFSTQDKDSADLIKIDNYLVTPKGIMKKYDYKLEKDKIKVLNKIGPYYKDPSKPKDEKKGVKK